jgi:hypothetical protein
LSDDELMIHINALKATCVTNAGRIRRLEKWVDTVSSPLWKRLWFVVQGYRFRQLGVWYRARWNKDGWEF